MTPMKKQKNGQTLITLLIFMVIGITVTAAAVVLTISGSIKASKFQEGQITYQIAESGAENALMQRLRNPSYTGETITINGAPVTITVSGTNPITITSTALNGNYQRKIQIVAIDTNGILTVNSWNEVF
ncbi:hypothetical protein A2Z00_00870 [Candidatus Gottesmanbacteria bacterium RBG_13_45_10]|uniref:Type 4 fimbrial biogenesis protein PilX N-terminal domain-containing protein n=1 Tax=Candidatus Gottesmanbacteria bacterium RBG_13_45_10 TaxID=1798370 RepID=A0A1F5ZHT4_9BACT|nr:MAG: hypothetical protein A2Z00_00870 [Candidatus Gottesmanbacteria bacterium RBG_13_45_10]